MGLGARDPRGVAAGTGPVRLGGAGLPLPASCLVLPSALYVLEIDSYVLIGRFLFSKDRRHEEAACRGLPDPLSPCPR